MKKIVQKEDPVLRKKAKEIPVHDITSASVKKVIAEMKKTLAKESDGVAIAAPQIGESLRIFVVAGKAIDMVKGVETESPDYMPSPDETYINPVITKRSREKKLMEEGCLSVRYLYGKIERSVRCSVTAYDEKGKKFERGASGLLAQIFQHETDHLDGILFIDSAVDLEDLPPEK